MVKFYRLKQSLYNQLLQENSINSDGLYFTTDTHNLYMGKWAYVSSTGETYDDTAIKADISALQTKKADKSEVYTKSETDSAITSKVAEIVADAPEDFDTLKEMSDWIASHENSASAMNSAIQTNADNISNLQENKANASDLNNYVTKITGKGSSTNDYTTDDKNKLDSLENYDDKVGKSIYVD